MYPLNPVFRYRQRKHQGYACGKLIKITAFSCPIKHKIRYYHLSHCRLKNKNGQIIKWLSRCVLPISIKRSCLLAVMVALITLKILNHLLWLNKRHRCRRRLNNCCCGSISSVNASQTVSTTINRKSNNIILHYVQFLPPQNCNKILLNNSSIVLYKCLYTCNRWFLIYSHTMGESITDQELRRRLLTFNTVVPPVTNSTRRLLVKKLADLESRHSSQIDSPKSNDISLINVSNWNHSASEDEDKNSYLFTGLLLM